MMRVIYIISILILSLSVSAQNYEGKAVAVDFSFGLNKLLYCDFYEFTINAKTKLENEYLKALQQKYVSSGFFIDGTNKNVFLKVKSILSFNWKGKNVGFVRYAENTEEISDRNLTFSTDDSSEFLRDAAYITRLSNDGFWQFYNNIDNDNFGNINRLKPLTKDGSGNLNISQLADVIRENENVLKEYILD